MTRHQRLGLWIASISACGLSPVQFRLIAPWAGAAWQCVCLGAILALYATTPADAIKLQRWVSKIVIVAGMAAWPWLCTGRVTWALVVATLVVLVADHVPITFTWPVGARSLHLRARWSWVPGVVADWLAAPLLWSPIIWIAVCSREATRLPLFAIPASVCAAAFVLGLNMPQQPPWRRPGWWNGRIGLAAVVLIVQAAAILAYAQNPGL